jgi:23S rRNA pseudouridine955/2504/2580 synthase
MLLYYGKNIGRPNLVSTKRDLEILFEDKEIVVVNKPAMLAVQPGKNVKITVIDILEEKYGGEKLFPVHRLDMDTAGCLIVAKTKESAGKYATLFADKKMEKIYLAIAAGHFSSPHDVIREVIEVDGKKKSAETFYKVLKKFGRFSLLELKITTGRMHQIRIHLAKIHHPIIGDNKYGDFKLNKEIAAKNGIKNLMLFAQTIKLGNKTIRASLPEHFNAFLKLFNITI